MVTIRIFLTFVLILTVQMSFSQITAYAENGKIVLLRTDSTWTYIDDVIDNIINFEQYPNWKIDYYVDNFGDKTKEYYRYYIHKGGKFSNSATSGSNLTTRVIIDGTGVRFDLLEYGSGPAVGEETGKATYNLSVKSDGEIFSYPLMALKNSLILYKKDIPRFLKMLKLAQNELKCYIEISGIYSTSTYNFLLAPLD